MIMIMTYYFRAITLCAVWQEDLLDMVTALLSSIVEGYWFVYETLNGKTKQGFH